MKACQRSPSAQQASRSLHRAPYISKPAVLGLIHRSLQQPCFGPKLSTRTRQHTPRRSNGTAVQEPELRQEDQQQQQQQQQQQEPFSWVRNWYPAIPVSYLDATRPAALTLLGKPLVLWKDAAGTWNCFEDACPHRLAPLSEGRVEADGLMCSYHGWRFNSEGACTRIPQAEDAKSGAAACSSRRACATRYPCREVQGLLWVWPDASSSAQQDSAAQALPVSPVVEKFAAGGGPLKWYMRDLPYSYEILLENLTDPAHLPFSHHKLSAGLSRDKGGAMPMRPAEPAAAGTSGTGVAERPAFKPVFSETFISFSSPDTFIEFFAPSLVAYEFLNKAAQSSFSTILYATPTRPGQSRVFTLNASAPYKRTRLWDVVKALGKPTFQRALFSFIITITPTWKMHTNFSNKLFDQDSIFLAMQQQRLRSKASEGSSWAKAYYMPTSCDRAVISTRRWIDSTGGSGPYVYSTAGEEAEAGGLGTRRQLLDRFEQHTKHCGICKAKLRQVEQTISTTPVIGAALFAALCGLLGTVGLPALLAGGWASAAAAAAALGLGACAFMHAASQKLWHEFHFVDFSHADNH